MPFKEIRRFKRRWVDLEQREEHLFLNVFSTVMIQGSRSFHKSNKYMVAVVIGKIGKLELSSSVYSFCYFFPFQKANESLKDGWSFFVSSFAPIRVLPPALFAEFDNFCLTKSSSAVHEEPDGWIGTQESSKVEDWSINPESAILL